MAGHIIFGGGRRLDWMLTVYNRSGFFRCSHAVMVDGLSEFVVYPCKSKWV